MKKALNPIALSLACIVMPSTLMAGSLDHVVFQKVKTRPEMSSKVIGGGDAADHEAPFFTQIILYDKETGFYGNFCGGSIINDKYILTAAHCLDDDKFVDGWTPDHLHVLVKNPTTDDVYSDEFKKAKAFTMHPDYVESNLWINDVAVIELEYAITDNVESITLPQDFGDYSSRDKYQIFGLGYTSTMPNTKPNLLQRAALKPLDDTECESSINGFHFDESMCATGVPNETYTAICNGDSGGPLTYIDDSGKYQQIGVSSYGMSVCEDPAAPSVFAEILNYVTWIEGLTSDGNPIVFDADLAKTEGYHSDGDTKAGEGDPSEPVDPPKQPEPFDPDPNFEPSGGSMGIFGVFGLLLLSLRKRRTQ